MHSSLALLAAADVHSLPLLTTLSAGFTAAWIFGLLTQKIGLSPIVGYLLGGILVGPYTPGFVADQSLANQLAEVGVILLMFAVGLHFHVKDLVAVKNIAIPGAVVQSTVATLLGLAVATAFGWDLKSGLVIGMAMAVASTVVLMRVLIDNDALETTPGHVAVGWLIVEDIFTVILLILIPAMAATDGEGESSSLIGTLLLALVKLAVLVILLLTVGAKLIRWVMIQVTRLRSRELFTLTVLVFAVAIATASAWLFSVSMALGAFLAGMAVAQSPVSQQAAAEALPLHDAFAVIFFVSVGMLFDPSFVLGQPLLVLSALGIVMIGKPLAALLIVGLLGYSLRTGLVVAIGLGQIGEFSFILAKLARDNGLIAEEGLSMLVATAIISITVNPLLFANIGRIERAIERNPRLWRLLNRRERAQADTVNEGRPVETAANEQKPRAVIVGYGPVGRTADRLLRGGGLETVIIDLNMDTVRSLHAEDRPAVFGDASREEVLRHAGIEKARFLIVTLPHSLNREPMISMARSLQPEVVILTRARYLRERPGLVQSGADGVFTEETEAAIALARLTLRHLGNDEEGIEGEVGQLREDIERTNLFQG